ncbi:MAG TPA: sigma factor-like helix-turn-helix DNA-binding protein [Gemmataceae bacterium]|nr:sigma factor-like helix-turn-helix DNA-binding protein [Gemmataceae bacterium]
MPEPEAKDGGDAWRDLRSVLDQELSRLPDKYRVPVVLCDLEGRTLRGVAQQLGVPAGTLSGRLTIARGLLARRLARRGLALSVGALTAALSEGAASACVPPPLVALTVEAATAVTTGKVVAGVVSSRVAALAEGVVGAMFVQKLKIATAVLVMAGTVIGAALLAHRPTAAQPPAGGPARTRTGPPQADGPEVKALLKERQDVLKREAEARSQQFEAGRGLQAPLLAVCRELLKAELELATKPEERVAAHERYFNAMRKFEQFVKEGYEAGRIMVTDHFQIQAARLEAEIGLRRAGGKPPKEKAEGK